MNIWPAARTTWIFFKHNEVLTLFNYKTKRFLFKIKLNSPFFLQIWLAWSLAGGVSQPLWALQVSGFYQVYMNVNYNLEDISLRRQKKKRRIKPWMTLGKCVMTPSLCGSSIWWGRNLCPRTKRQLCTCTVLLSCWDDNRFQGDGEAGPCREATCQLLLSHLSSLGALSLGGNMLCG